MFKPIRGGKTNKLLCKFDADGDQLEFLVNGERVVINLDDHRRTAIIRREMIEEAQSPKEI